MRGRRRVRRRPRRPRRRWRSRTPGGHLRDGPGERLALTSRRSGPAGRAGRWPVRTARDALILQVDGAHNLLNAVGRHRDGRVAWGSSPPPPPKRSRGSPACTVGSSSAARARRRLLRRLRPRTRGDGRDVRRRGAGNRPAHRASSSPTATPGRRPSGASWARAWAGPTWSWSPTSTGPSRTRSRCDGQARRRRDHRGLAGDMMELLEGVSEERVVLAADRVDPGEHEALGLLVARQRRSRPGGRHP